MWIEHISRHAHVIIIIVLAARKLVLTGLSTERCNSQYHPVVSWFLISRALWMSETAKTNTQLNQHLENSPIHHPVTDKLITSDQISKNNQTASAAATIHTRVTVPAQDTTTLRTDIFWVKASSLILTARKLSLSTSDCPFAKAGNCLFPGRRAPVPRRDRIHRC